MNGLKNIVVIVLLLGISYGAYQVINAPSPTSTYADNDLVEPQIEIHAPTTGGPEWPTLPPPPDGTLSSPRSTELVQPAPTAPPSTSPSALPNPPSLASSPAPSPSGLDVVQSPALDRTLPDSAQFDAPPLTNAEESRPSTTSAAATAAPPSGFQPPPAETPLAATPNQGLSPAGPLAPIEPMPSSSTTGSMANSEVPAGNEFPVVDGVPDAGPLEINWAEIDQLVAKSNYRRALLTLTTYYRAELAEGQREQLIQWLDALAGKVIYSTEHWFDEQPYVVAPDDTLASISQAWNVPPQLVYNINRAKIPDPAKLVPGTELKVVQGPFRAELDVKSQELTVFCGGLYAGRFPVTIGGDLKWTSDVMQVQAKTESGMEYRDALGVVFAADDPNNPLGPVCIDLGDGVVLHSARGSSADPRAKVQLSQEDAVDLYAILSPRSTVKILR